MQRAETPDKSKPGSILSHFENAPDFDQIAFIDGVTRNLRRGRMLLLIVGDGIRHGLDALTSYLQLHPGFHATIGLVELKLYKAPDGGYFVQPRTLMKTLNIERGVVSFNDDRVSISSPTVAVPVVKDEVPKQARAKTISEEMFFEELAKKCPDDVAKLKSLISQVEEFGVTPEYKKTLILRWLSTDGRPINFGYVGKDGPVYFDAASWKLQQGTAEWDASEKYRKTIADAVGGTVEGKLPNGRTVYAGDRPIRLPLLVKHQKAWLNAMQEFITSLQDIARRSDDAGGE